MLETPSIRRYSLMSQPFFRVWAWEVKIRSVRTISRKGSGLKMVEAIDRLENPQRPNADHLTSYIGSRHEMKLWSEPYGDVGRPAETSGPLASHYGQLVVTVKSEIPCRVSSDLHEWRNDFPTVSTTDPAKLKYE